MTAYVTNEWSTNYYTGSNFVFYTGYKTNSGYVGVQTNLGFWGGTNLIITGTNAPDTVDILISMDMSFTNGFVDSSITNYSTTTNYALTLASNLVRVAAGTNATVTTSNDSGAIYYFVSVPGTNGFVDNTITNYSATTNYTFTLASNLVQVAAGTNATVTMSNNAGVMYCTHSSRASPSPATLE